MISLYEIENDLDLNLLYEMRNKGIQINDILSKSQKKEKLK